MTISPTKPANHNAGSARRANFSAYLGSTIENYDFLLYGSAAAVVFGPVFFADLEPLAATTASLLTFAAGYIARPLGGIVFGHFGDKYGRKKMLMLSLWLMGIGSFLIGTIPSPELIGAWGAIILVTLRLLQGFAIGGEWGGAALMSLEHAQQDRRGFAAAFTNAGAPSGAVLATALLALAALLPEEAFLAWGWRIPFLLSAALLAVGLYVRKKVNESPVFEQHAAENTEKSRSPFLAVMRRPQLLIAVVLATMSGGAMQTLLATFGVGLAAQNGIGRSAALFSFAFAQLIAIFMVLFFGRLSDKLGRRTVIIFGLVGTAAFVYPALAMLSSGKIMLVILAFVIAGAVFVAAAWGPAAALISEQFATASRYTGASMAFQLASVLAGFTPGIAAGLVASSKGATTNVGIFIILMCAVSIVCLMLLRETSKKELKNA